MAADGVGAGLIPPSADRQTILRIAGQQALAALGNLTPGTPFSGRVVGPANDGLWSVVVRGTTLTVASPIPLTPDSILRFLVVAGGTDGPLQVKLADLPLPTLADTLKPAIAERLASLGLPATPEAQAVLEAFESVGAPLSPPRLRQATQILEQAAQEPAPLAEEDPEEAPAPLPNRPATVATTPAPSSPPKSSSSASPTPRAPEAPRAQPSATPGTPAAKTAVPPGTPAPLTSNPAPALAAPTTPHSAALPPGIIAPRLVEASVHETNPAPPIPDAPESVPTRPPTGPTTLAADPRLPVVFALLAKADLPGTPATLAVALRAASDRLPDPVTAVQAWKPDLALPDVTTDDAPAALRAVVTALVLAGVRPRAETTAPEGPSQRPAIAVPEDAPEPLLTTVAQAVAKEAPSDFGGGAVRELATDLLLPPKHLDEYDRVFPLPLLAQGQATPARVAVSSREMPNGTRATWMRVDCELSRLGPVSIRLSGAEGGPIAITVVARPGAARHIADGLPALVADLQERGLPAAVRVVEDEPW